MCFEASELDCTVTQQWNPIILTNEVHLDHFHGTPDTVAHWLKCTALVGHVLSCSMRIEMNVHVCVLDVFHFRWWAEKQLLPVLEKNLNVQGVYVRVCGSNKRGKRRHTLFVCVCVPKGFKRKSDE